MGRITFRMPDPLEQDVREMVKTSKYVSLSELLRDLTREWVENHKNIIRTATKR